MTRITTQSIQLLAASIVAAVLTLTGTLAFLSWDVPQNTNQAHPLEPKDMRFMMGSGNVANNQITVTSFSNGYALISSGPIEISADQFRFLRVALDADENSPAPIFFWRSAVEPKDTKRLTIRETGDILLDLSSSADWSGAVSEIGLLLQGAPDNTIRIGPLWLEPDNLRSRLRLVWRDWTAFEGWSQKSINFLRNGKANQTLRLPVVVLGWLALTLVLFALVSTRSKHSNFGKFVFGGCLVFLIAWMILDVRWTANTLEQAQKTADTLWGLDDAERMRLRMDGGLKPYIERLKADVLPPNPVRILIVGDAQTSAYVLGRARYHLLPHSAVADEWPPANSEPSALGYVLFFSASAEPHAILNWTRGWKQKLKIIERNGWGVLFRVSDEH